MSRTINLILKGVNAKVVEICAHPIYVKVLTLWSSDCDLTGNRINVDRIAKMRSHWYRVGPSSNRTDILVRREETQTPGRRWPRATEGREEGSILQAQATTNCRQPPEDTRQDSFLQVSEGAQPLFQSICRTLSGSPNKRTEGSCRTGTVLES